MLKHAGIWGKTILVREDRQNKVLECLGAQKEVTEAGVDGRCSRDRLMQALRVVIEMMALILSDVGNAEELEWSSDVFRLIFCEYYLNCCLKKGSRQMLKKENQLGRSYRNAGKIF